MELVRPLLQRENLEKLTEEQAKRIYNEMTVGGPQLYPQTFIENGIEKIGKSLIYLLYSDSSLEDRFYNVVSNPESEYRLNGVGRAFASTALFLVNHHDHAIWNGAVDGGLEKLGVLPKKERGEHSGQRYVKITKVLKEIGEKCGFEDFSITDEFVELIFHGKLDIGQIVGARQPEPDLHEEEKEDDTHTKMQWMLAKIGIMRGHDVWVAYNDRNKVYKEEKLADFCLKELPSFASPEVLNIAKSIDVIWFKKKSSQPLRIFEIEHTTSIYSGLLRLNDVKVDYPIVKASIVGPKIRQELFESQLKRKTFIHTELNEVCDYLNYEDVEEFYEAQKKVEKF
ncbi:MAG: hypothetical protein H3Z51_06865 [archaeon]|nr:hypothetical protein [archaeon]